MPNPARLSRWITHLLLSLCIGVTAAAVTWKAWDMFGPARKPMLQGWNDSFYYFWLPAVVIDHDLDFSKPLATSRTVNSAARVSGLAQAPTKTGLLPNKYPPGWALGSLPFFLLAHAFAPAGSTGFEPIYLLAVWLGQILYAAGGLVLAGLIIRRLLPAAPASIAVLTVWLASPLVYYQSARVSLSHSQIFSLAMAVFWLTLRISDGDRRAGNWIGLGFASALMVVTRNITIVYLAFPVAMLGRELVSSRSIAWFAAGAAVPSAIQLLAWKLLFGSWIAYSYGSERFNFSDLHLADVLFSANHGLFYWHPLLLVGTLSLLAWSYRHRVARPWLVSFAVITVLNAAWPCWWFASSFGNRGFEIPIFFAMVGVAVLLAATRHHRVWRPIVAGTIAVAIGWNLLVFSVFLTRRIPQESAVTWSDDVRAFVRWFDAGEIGRTASEAASRTR